MKTSLKIYTFAFALCALGAVLPANAVLTQQPLYASGEGGYSSYRIPSLLVTKTGTVLAFCEGRKEGMSDTGNIDLLVKRSEDHGDTWSAQKVVWDDKDNTCGNPCPVLDRDTGILWLLMTWNRGDDPEKNIIAQTSKDTRRVFVSSSADDGRTWGSPQEITVAAKQESWSWYATGPGAGIQLTQGVHAGRLVIPCDHIEKDTEHYYSHIIYSDDHGATWQLGGSTPRGKVNECEVVELRGGRLLLNMRNYDRSRRYRQVAFSDDGGITWTGQRFDKTLIEPICQASIRSMGDRILFSNPADTKKRINMCVRQSFDEGSTWSVLHILHPGPSAYSSLALLADGRAACFYERGNKQPYETITLARFTLPVVTAVMPGCDTP
ncbi:MAG: exo-alpha-sialidase [Candidatus Hydrogenedentes bacterium]|nr:exo-alpha-sialidase [Candidatus Hydrogenedentota bacterium]